MKSKTTASGASLASVRHSTGETNHGKLPMLTSSRYSILAGLVTVALAASSAPSQTMPGMQRPAAPRPHATVEGAASEFLFWLERRPGAKVYIDSRRLAVKASTPTHMAPDGRKYFPLSGKGVQREPSKPTHSVSSVVRAEAIEMQTGERAEACMADAAAAKCFHDKRYVLGTLGYPEIRGDSATIEMVIFGAAERINVPNPTPAQRGGSGVAWAKLYLVRRDGAWHYIAPLTLFTGP